MPTSRRRGSRPLGVARAPDAAGRPCGARRRRAFFLRAAASRAVLAARGGEPPRQAPPANAAHTASSFARASFAKMSALSVAFICSFADTTTARVPSSLPAMNCV